MSLQTTKRELLAKVRLSFLTQSDKELLENILSFDKDELNNHYKNGVFPAWDIAYNISKNNWQISKAQRKSLINVTSYYYVDLIIKMTIQLQKEKRV